MSGDQASEEGLRRILRLAPDCDPTKLALTAEEGFLLSRIDGNAPWRLLREIGGMDPEEADLCVEGWIASGIVKVEGLEAPPKPPPSRAAATRESALPVAAQTPGQIDESAIDATLDLDEATQRHILDFETRLGLPYHELLGVDEDADVKEVKRAYFKLSREFHPDRYFRRDIGAFEARLERIFKKVLEGYEILSDPELREQLANQPAAEVGGGAPGTPVAAPPNRPLTKLERLRQRMPFRIPEKLMAERRQKALELMRAAAMSEAQGNLAEAASSVRVAISFDPTNVDCRSRLVDLQANLAEKRALDLLEEFSASYGSNKDDLGRVLRQLEEVLLYRPHDPLLNSRAAGVALQLGELGKAEECARIALEHSPEVAEYHTTMGLLHKAKGEIGHAKNELEQALEIDPDDVQARKALASLRLGRTAVLQEGHDG